MKTRYFLLLAAMGLLASCTKEADAPQINEEVTTCGKTYLTVNLDTATKTYLGDDGTSTHKVYWSNGDKIKVDEFDSDALTGLVGDNSSATFIINGVLDDNPHNVLYPLSAWEDATHISLPAVQTYESGNIANNMLPLAGQSNNGNITLHHLCAILKIQVLRETTEHASARSELPDEHQIRTIRFKGRSSEKISGSFVINYATPALTATTGTGTDLVTRITQDQATSTTDAVIYYLVVPARTYSAGFQVDILDEKGHCMSKSKVPTPPATITLEAGHMYAMAPFEFVPTTTEVGIEISSAADLVQFASDFNAGTIAQNANVTLTNDIVFNASTSAAFNATGGINGGKNYTGIFNGNGYTISGLEATVPMFNDIGSGAAVKDFTLNGSFALTHGGLASLGALAKQQQGNISGITVNADVTLAGTTEPETAHLDLGGLVGRVNAASASVSNCKFNGNITIPSDYSTDKSLRIGGLVGYASKKTPAVSISDCSFGGTIKCLGHATSSYSVPNSGIQIGGIIGRCEGASITNCSSIDAASQPSVIISETTYKATILVQTASTKWVAIGGIAGLNYNGGSISSCINRATIFDNVTTASSTLDVGGIVGHNSNSSAPASVSGVINYAQITHLSSSPAQRLGGVIGYETGNSSNCTNETSGTVTVNSSAQNMRVGGVIGEKAGGELSETISNKGGININAITAYGCEVGGVIGRNTVAIDGGASKTIKNASDITITNSTVKFTEATESNEYGLFFGGIVGYSTNAVKNANNSGNLEYVCSFTGDSGTEGGAKFVHMGGIIGKINADSLVDVESCTNTGNIKFDPTTTAPHMGGDPLAHTYAVYSNCYLGGIAGYAKLVNIKGTSSNKTTNSGNIFGGDGSGNYNSDATFWVGGIVGKLTGASSSISYCELIGVGKANNNHFSNRSITGFCPMCGGIVGEILGVDSEHATVSNCNIASTADVIGRRGRCGGIVGYARFADISDCTMPKSFGNSAYAYGGIVSWLRNGSVTNCTFSGSAIRSSQMTEGGGIVGYLQIATIDGCRSYATDISKNGTAVTATGALAGQGSDNTASNIIKKSHYKASMTKICGNNKYTAGTGSEANAADL